MASCARLSGELTSPAAAVVLRTLNTAAGTAIIVLESSPSMQEIVTIASKEGARITQRGRPKGMASRSLVSWRLDQAHATLRPDFGASPKKKAKAMGSVGVQGLAADVDFTTVDSDA